MEKKTSRRSSAFSRSFRILLAVAVLAVIFAMPAFAASSKKGVKTNQWVTKNGYYYYRGNDGNCVTGVQVIKKKCYLFDTKGRQLHGWRKLGNRYFFFKNKNGAKGNLAVSTTINGIVINEKGVAQLTSSEAKLKAETMANYSLWTDSFIRPTMTNKEKLYACRDVLTGYGYLSEGDSIIKKSNWDVICASEMYDRRNKGPAKKRANCYRFAAAFAYMANSIGYTDIKCCGYVGHGWMMIGNNVFDVIMSIKFGLKYFPVPNYRNNRYNATSVRDLRQL